MQTTDRDALIRIQAIWLAWARHELTEEDALAGIAETLEEIGLPVIEEISSSPDDHGPQGRA